LKEKENIRKIKEKENVDIPNLNMKKWR